jgi:NADPH-dependent 2,4-dienoyl-CoA reductase/sulfur reductase-like enzyme
MKQTILVAGGLAAGPSAASKAKRINPDAEVILFEQGEHVSYGICEVPYYIGGIVTEFDQLNPLDPAKLERSKGIKVKVGHSVEEILSTKKKLVVRDLNRDKLTEFAYDKLILATGSIPREINVEGSEAKNIFRVKSLSDGIAIKRFIDEKKPARCVIVGGGYVGMEMCEAFVDRGIKVVLLHTDDYPMNGLENETRKTVHSELVKNGVDFKQRQNVTRFVSDAESTIRSVVTDSASFDCDFVILAVGVEPNTDLASKARIHLGQRHGILTDERQSTNIDSIFAAGDCCEVKNMITGKWLYIPLATYASRQGRVAGENAAGGRAVFKGAIRSIAVKVFGIEVAQVGISSSEAQENGFDFIKVQVTTDSKVAYFPENTKIDIVAIADKRSHRLLGANIYGGPGSVLRADVLGLAIQQRMTVDELSQIDLIYSPPFSPLWDPVLILANQLKGKLNFRS